MKRILLVLIFGVILVSSCKKDKESAPIITLSPSSLAWSAYQGDVVKITVSVQSSANLSRFYITQEPENGIYSTVLDSSVSGTSLKYVFQYVASASLMGKSIFFGFHAVDVNGLDGSKGTRVYVLNDTSTVFTETTGHQMYSNGSANPDAYDLELNQPKFSSVVDSTFRDIQDNSGTLATDTVLLRSWKSPAGGKFVKANGFDYANATLTSTKNTYDAGTKLDLLNGIAINDVIITKLGSVTSEKYAVIKVTSIVDAVGKDNDSYIFNIKK